VRLHSLILVAIGLPGLVQAQMHAVERLDLLDPDVTAQLVRQGARFGLIRINAENVFDTSKPGEDKALYKFTNRVHIKTHDGILENILLFESGDPFDPQVLLESERLLRDRGWIADAVIVPEAYNKDSNTVDVVVTTRDSWSLSSDISFGRNGGKNHSGFGFEEKNLFGIGKRLLISHESGVDRDRNLVGFTDEKVLGSWVRLDAVLASASDGTSSSLNLGRPFFSLNTRWSFDTRFLDDERIDQMYDLGAPVDVFQHLTRTATIEGGWSRGLIDGRVRRWLVGLGYDRHIFGPALDSPEPSALPDDRLLIYPFVGYQLIRDDFRRYFELNDMGRIEDVQLGLNLNARLGYSSPALGADRDALLLDVTARKGWLPSDAELLTMEFAASARRESAGFKNTLVSTNATYYRKMFSKQMLTVSLDLMATSGLDLDQQVLLGGDSGLRGYPLRYQSGTSRALLRLEQRHFTDWYPLKLLRVGFAAFFDAGRTWGEDPRGTPSRGMLYDVGLGLRLSSPRSSRGSVVHIDFAVPLNGDESVSGIQVNVKTKGSF
jgi:hemolysin activation/secretion protein